MASAKSAATGMDAASFLAPAGATEIWRLYRGAKSFVLHTGGCASLATGYPLVAPPARENAAQMLSGS